MSIILRYIAGSKRQNHNLTRTRDTIATVREQHTDSHVLLSASSSSTQTAPIIGFPLFFLFIAKTAMQNSDCTKNSSRWQW